MKNLLITTIGKDNHFSAWIDGERNYDIAVINYDGSDQPKVSDKTCVFTRNQKTFKYPGIKDALVSSPELMRYAYYWMPDEDIWAKPDMINEIFDKMSEYDLWLAQPSVLNAEGSYPSWDCFIHKPSPDIIYTSFVEVMCPCFSRRALMTCLEVFSKSQSGWGQDLVWSALGEKERKGIINSVAIKHTRPVCNGNLYGALKANGIYPSRERKRLMAEYCIPKIDIRTWT
jgi:hypothetical protein